MKYIRINSYTHLFIHSLERQKVELEITLHAGGSWFESPQHRGQKHLLEHCIVSRTQAMDFQQLKDYTFRENIYVNAYTGPITMGFEASGHRDDFRKITDLLLELSFAPTFVQPDLDREKEIVLREISERRGDPNYRLHFDVQEKIYTPDSLEIHQVLGDAKQVAATTLEDFAKLHTQNLQNSHIFISVSGGGIDQTYLTDKIQEYLNSDNSYIRDFLQETDKKDIAFRPGSQFQDFHTLPIHHPLAHQHAELTVYLPCEITFENRPTLQILQNLFLRYGGVLYDRLRDELGLVYGLHSDFHRGLGQLILQVSCELKYIPQILAEIDQVFSDFPTNFRPQKFTDFKNILRKKEDLAQDTLGAPISHTINMLRSYGIMEEYTEYAKRLDAVTPKDIQKAYTYIQDNLKHKKVVMLSKDKAINSALANLE